MDPKLLRNYQSRQARPVFLKEEDPVPKLQPEHWLLIIAGVLAGLGVLTFLAYSIIAQLNPPL